MQAGTKEWHENRRLGIGGSDAAAALGLSKWKTPYQLYLEKIGESEPQDETWEMKRGKAMEPLLRQHYADETGRTIAVPNNAIIHPMNSFMRYNPDGLSDDRLQEFKTATYSKEWGEVGGDEIPHEYIIQVQHGMHVVRRQITDVMASIGGNKPKFFQVSADRELQEMIIEGEREFWKKVEDRIPPEPISNEDVAMRYSKVNGQSIIISPEISAILADLKRVRAIIKESEESKESLEVKIKDFMGANEVLVDDAGVPLVTWKQQKGAERIDSKRLRAERPDVAAEYVNIGDPIRRMLIK